MQGHAFDVQLPTPRASNSVPQPSTLLEIHGIAIVSGNAFAFSFATIPGRTYRVEYKDDLAAPAWIPLRPDEVAVGASLTISDPLASHPQRFYRVVLLP